MLTDEERRRGAEDLLRAERERKVVPQLSRTFPNIEIEDAYAIQRLWAEGRIAQGAQDHRTQDRADFEGHADGLQDDRAGLRASARRHAVQ